MSDIFVPDTGINVTTQSQLVGEEYSLTIRAWDHTRTVPFATNRSFDLAFKSEMMTLGSEQVPWISTRPMYRRYASRKRWQVIKLLPSFFAKRLEDELFTMIKEFYPRHFAVKYPRGKTKGTITLMQPMEIGPNLAFDIANKRIIHRSVATQGHNRKTKRVHPSWLSPEERWISPQYEYLAREELIKP